MSVRDDGYGGFTVGPSYEVASLDPQEPAPHFTRVSNGNDWEGVYVNGKLVTQGHSIDLRVLAEALGYKYSFLEVTPEWSEDEGEFPTYLGNIPQEARR